MESLIIVNIVLSLIAVGGVGFAIFVLMEQKEKQKSLSAEIAKVDKNIRLAEQSISNKLKDYQTAITGLSNDNKMKVIEELANIGLVFEDEFNSLKVSIQELHPSVENEDEGSENSVTE